MRIRLVPVLLASVGLALMLSALAGARPMPDTIQLPNGWLPEGIEIGPGKTLYSGSRANGAVWAADLRTGEGEIRVPGQEGNSATGLKIDSRGRLFVSGAGTGEANIYDAATGATLATYQLGTPPATFVNDVVVTSTAAYFTESFALVLYKIPIAPDGTLGPAETIPLTGDIVLQPGFNVNGIDAKQNGRTLFLVQSNTGKLFTADPETGVTNEIDLGGESVPSGDGILLDGRNLYVVQNFFNQIAKVHLSSDLERGEVVSRTTDPRFDIPTTIAEFGNRLYAVNARFTTPPTPETPYNVVAIPKP